MTSLAAEPWPGEKKEWKGYARYEFEVGGRAAWVTAPMNAASGKPWVWRARFPGFHTGADEILLARGFHIAHLNTNGMLGSPRAMAHWDAFYRFVTKRGLAKRVALEGVSRGGLFVYGFAAEHPERVACLYADTPVCDFKSWPGGRGKGLGHDGTWKALLKEYRLTDGEALAYDRLPIDRLKPLADQHVPLLHIVSLDDRVVPPDENTFVLAKRYRELGGDIQIIEVPQGTKRSNGHHFRHPDPVRVADFIERYATPRVVTKTLPGDDWFELRGRFENSRVRFEREKKGRVAFVGGSITQMRGWREMTIDYLRSRFPETKFDFVSAGIASMGSTPGAFRLERDAFGRGPVDLLFEEAAVNDLHNGRSEDERRRGMEGIVRRARSLNPNVDIVVMHFVDPNHMRDYRAGKLPKVIKTHEEVTQHYELPSLHLALEVTQRIDAGEFTWEKDFRNLHPSPFGHRLYASTIRRLFSTVWSKPLATDSRIVPHRMPEKALDRFSYDRGRYVDVRGAQRQGFELVEKCDPRRDGIGGGVRPGFVNVPMLEGKKPGDSFRFRFRGRGVGLFVAAGPDTGVIEYRIDGSEPERVDLFTKWSGRLHLPWAYVLDAELSDGEHELEVKITDQKNPKSDGHACRVVHMLVNGSR